MLTAPTTKSRDPLAGEGGWTEVAPTFTNDDIATANQQFADVLETCRIWVNGDPAADTTTVGPSDEIAVLPPVSGGDR